jgi:Protein of Unknown function (DUF2784)
VIVGLCGGVVSGLSLRGALVAARSGVAVVAVPLSLLVATVLLSCATAWTFFTESLSSDGWSWLAGGVVVGWGRASWRIGGRPGGEPGEERRPLAPDRARGGARSRRPSRGCSPGSSDTASRQADTRWVGYLVLAEITMAVHFAFLAYVVAGGFLAWRWPRAIWPHLVFAGWGLSTLVFHQNCPLSLLEDWARRHAGVPGLKQRGFIDTYLTGVVYPARDLALVQALVGAIIAMSWAGVLLRHRRRPRPHREAW